MTHDAALYVGLMSGTSADGIDAALCTFDPQPRLLAAIVHPWPDALRRRMLAVAQGDDAIDLDAWGRLDTAIGENHADAVQALLRQADVQAAEVRAIGMHGQTMRHRPDGDTPFTLQAGNAWLVAERCGIDTVADFRRADMAAGGQGAPLIPAFHATALAATDVHRAVLNLGGIGNLTLLRPDGHVSGFDTGPANGLLDAWCQRHRDEPFDRDGAFAASGHCDDALLEQMLSDDYFSRPPPKSTGREHFHLAWVNRHSRVATLSPADVQATLLALTIRSIAAALRAHVADAEELLVCGGGVHNHALMQSLAAAVAPCALRSTAALGVDPDYMEAMGFAWLARQRVLGRPGNLPAVTGASGPRLLGAIYPAPATQA